MYFLITKTNSEMKELFKLEGDLLDLTKDINDVTNLKVKLSKHAKRINISTGLFVINDIYISNKQYRTGENLLAIPKVCHISKYQKYLQDLYNSNSRVEDNGLCICMEEKVHRIEVLKIESVSMTFQDALIKSISNEQVSIKLKTNDNILTKYLIDAVSKIGSRYTSIVYGDYEVENLDMSNVFSIEKDDIYVNRWGTAVY